MTTILLIILSAIFFASLFIFFITDAGRDNSVFKKLKTFFIIFCTLFLLILFIDVVESLSDIVSGIFFWLIILKNIIAFIVDNFIVILALGVLMVGIYIVVKLLGRLGRFIKKLLIKLGKLISKLLIKLMELINKLLKKLMKFINKFVKNRKILKLELDKKDD